MNQEDAVTSTVEITETLPTNQKLSVDQGAGPSKPEEVTDQLEVPKDNSNQKSEKFQSGWKNSLAVVPRTCQPLVVFNPNPPLVRTILLPAFNLIGNNIQAPSPVLFGNHVQNIGFGPVHNTETGPVLNTVTAPVQNTVTRRSNNYLVQNTGVLNNPSIPYAVTNIQPPVIGNIFIQNIHLGNSLIAQNINTTGSFNHFNLPVQTIGQDLPVINTDISRNITRSNIDLPSQTVGPGDLPVIITDISKNLSNQNFTEKDSFKNSGFGSNTQVKADKIEDKKAGSNKSVKSTKEGRIVRRQTQNTSALPRAILPRVNPIFCVQGKQNLLDHPNPVLTVSTESPPTKQHEYEIPCSENNNVNEVLDLRLPVRMEMQSDTTCNNEMTDLGKKSETETELKDNPGKINDVSKIHAGTQEKAEIKTGEKESPAKDSSANDIQQMQHLYKTYDKNNGDLNVSGGSSTDHSDIIPIHIDLTSVKKEVDSEDDSDKYICDKVQPDVNTLKIKIPEQIDKVNDSMTKTTRSDTGRIKLTEETAVVIVQPLVKQEPNTSKNLESSIKEDYTLKRGMETNCSSIKNDEDASSVSIKKELDVEYNLIGTPLEDRGGFRMPVLKDLRESELLEKKMIATFFVCNTCVRLGRTISPFPNGASLADHVREEHHKMPNITGPQLQFTLHTERIDYYCMPVVQEKIYPCKFGNCTRKFTSTNLLRRHIIVAHCRDIRLSSFKKCRFRHCERIFSTQDLRREHIQNFHINKSTAEDDYGALWVIKTSFNNEKDQDNPNVKEIEYIHEEAFKEMRSFFSKTYQVERFIITSGDYFVSFWQSCSYCDPPNSASLEKYEKLQPHEKKCTVSNVCEEIKNCYGDFIIDINNVKSRMLDSGIIVHNKITGCCVFIDDCQQRSKVVSHRNFESLLSSPIDSPSSLNRDREDNRESPELETVIPNKAIIENIKPKDVEMDIGDLVFLYGKPDPNYSPGNNEIWDEPMEDEAQNEDLENQTDSEQPLTLSCTANVDKKDSDVIANVDNKDSNVVNTVTDRIDILDDDDCLQFKEEPLSISDPIIKTEDYWDVFGCTKVAESINKDDVTLKKKSVESKSEDKPIKSKEDGQKAPAHDVKPEGKVHMWTDHDIGSCISISDSMIGVEDILNDFSESLKMVEQSNQLVKKSTNTNGGQKMAKVSKSQRSSVDGTKSVNNKDIKGQKTSKVSRSKSECANNGVVKKDSSNKIVNQLKAKFCDSKIISEINNSQTKNKSGRKLSGGSQGVQNTGTNKNIDISEDDVMILDMDDDGENDVIILDDEKGDETKNKRHEEKDKKKLTERSNILQLKKPASKFLTLDKNKTIGLKNDTKKSSETVIQKNDKTNHTEKQHVKIGKEENTVNLKGATMVKDLKDSGSTNKDVESSKLVSKIQPSGCKSENQKKDNTNSITKPSRKPESSGSDTEDLSDVDIYIPKPKPAAKKPFHILSPWQTRNLNKIMKSKLHNVNVKFNLINRKFSPCKKRLPHNLTNLKVGIRNTASHDTKHESDINLQTHDEEKSHDDTEVTPCLDTLENTKTESVPTSGGLNVSFEDNGCEIKPCSIQLFKLDEGDIKYICNQLKAGHSSSDYVKYLYYMHRNDAQDYDQLVNGRMDNSMGWRRRKRILQICNNLFKLNKYFMDNPDKLISTRKRKPKACYTSDVKKKKMDDDFDWSVFSDTDSFEDADDEFEDEFDEESENDVELCCPEPDCNRRFLSSLSLGRHLEKVHDERPPEERKHCPVENCDRSYSMQCNLMTHIKKEHGPDVYQEIKNELFSGIKSQKSSDNQQVSRPAGACLMPTVWRTPRLLLPPHVKTSTVPSAEPPKDVKEVDDIKSILSDLTQKGKGTFYSILTNK